MFKGFNSLLKPFFIAVKRILKSLMCFSMYIEYYFNPIGDRLVKLLVRKHIHIMKHKNIHLLTKVVREEFIQRIKTFITTESGRSEIRLFYLYVIPLVIYLPT